VVVTRMYFEAPAGARPGVPSQLYDFSVFEANCSNSNVRMSPRSEKWSELAELDDAVSFSYAQHASAASVMISRLCAMTGLPDKSVLPLRTKATIQTPAESRAVHPAIRCIGQGLKPGTSDFSKCIAN
jgi:hypothetical protein